MSLTPLRRDRLVTGPGPDGGGSKPPVRNGLPHMPEKSGMDAGPCAPLVADPAAGTDVCPRAGVAAAAANIANKRKVRCLCTPTSRSWFVGEMVTSGVRACGAAPFQHRCSVLLACPSRASPLPLIDRTSARPAGNLRITTIFRRACKGGYGRNWRAIAAPGLECRGGTAAHIRQHRSECGHATHIIDLLRMTSLAAVATS